MSTTTMAGKQVPLVVYKGGQRIVVGKAEVRDDGRIEAEVFKDLRPDISKLISGRVGDVSINPELPVVFPPSKTEYVTSSTKVQETKDGSGSTPEAG